MRPDPTLTSMDPEQGRLAACEGKARFSNPAVAHRVAKRSKYAGAAVW